MSTVVVQRGLPLEALAGVMPLRDGRFPFFFFGADDAEDHAYLACYQGIAAKGSCAV